MSPSGDNNNAACRTIMRLEWGIAILATLVALYLHCIRLANAGGLWRDEAGLATLATMPSLHQMWAMLPHDHCPILFPLIVRAWNSVGLGGTDMGLRILGLCVGLLIVAALWLASQAFRRGPPLFPSILAIINITVICSGASLRAYGLGCALNILTLAALWWLIQKPTFLRIALATLAAIFSVQCLYQNAFFVLAACCGGIVVCIKEYRWRDIGWILGIGGLSAASLIPYVHPMIQAQDWWVLEKVGFHFSEGWRNASTAMGFPLPWFNWVWVVLCLFAVGSATFILATSRNQPIKNQSGQSQNLILFTVVALIVGSVGFAMFLKIAGLPTQSWYYLPLLVFVAFCLDAILSQCGKRVRLALLVLAIPTVLMAVPLGSATAKYRQTNLDVIAEQLSTEVSPGDYIIVHPWYCGVTFARYYKGAATWTTLPPVEDHGIHRYDQFKAKLQIQNPIQTVLDKVATTLQSGHRVWLIGLTTSTSPPPAFNLATGNPPGWSYSMILGAQAGYFISAHSVEGARLPKFVEGPVNPLEDPFVLVARGWKDETTTNDLKATTP